MKIVLLTPERFAVSKFRANIKKIISIPELGIVKIVLLTPECFAGSNFFKLLLNLQKEDHKIEVAFDEACAARIFQERVPHITCIGSWQHRQYVKHSVIPCLNHSNYLETTAQ